MISFWTVRLSVAIRWGVRIGFPTANLRVSDPDKLIPCDGVYAVRVCVEGKEYGGMLSIGYRPTLENGPDRSIEVHIFRFDADIYQQPMRLSFVRRTRPELKFDSIEDLLPSFTVTRWRLNPFFLL